MKTYFINLKLTNKLMTYFILFVFYTNTSSAVTTAEIEHYAPLVKLHQDENYNPSSVEFFLDHVFDNNGFLTTKQPLKHASDTDIPFFSGQSVLNGNVPIYALVVPKPNIGPNITDVLYFTFYPYNRDKRVCVGFYSKTFGCAGKYSTFGNHVGDWEYILIRFDGNNPILLHLSTHDSGRTFPWGSPKIKMKSSHPIVYSAWGSHGLYEEAGIFIYRNLPNGDFLYDYTSENGVEWKTWKNVSIILHNPIGSYTAPFSWMNYSGRWGNHKRTCRGESITGECVLNDGPVGPSFKAAADTDGGPNDW